jgi:hypothetical protein
VQAGDSASIKFNPPLLLPIAKVCVDGQFCFCVDSTVGLAAIVGRIFRNTLFCLQLAVPLGAVAKW